MIKNEKILSELKQLLSKGKAVPVVGAGVSMATAKIPGWKDIIKRHMIFRKKNGRFC